MSNISVREFARRDGCDEALVRRAIKKKKLIAQPDGTLDESLVGSPWRQANRRSAPADYSAADKSAPVRTSVKNGRQQVERSAPAPSPAPDVEELLDASEKILRGEYLSELEAIRLKENALALKHLLAGRKLAGELVEASVAESVIFEEFRRFRDAWLSFTSRVAPLMAADLGVEQERVFEALTAHVYQQLADLGEPEADFGGTPADGSEPVAAGGAAGAGSTAKD